MQDLGILCPLAVELSIRNPLPQNIHYTHKCLLCVAPMFQVIERKLS